MSKWHIIASNNNVSMAHYRFKRYSVSVVLSLGILLSAAISSSFISLSASARTRVQSGETANTDGTDVTIDIDDVDTSKSIILFRYRIEQCSYTYVSPYRYAWAGRFTDGSGSPTPTGTATHITFHRAAGGASYTTQITWYVIESDAFDVEYHETSFSTTDTQKYVTLTKDFGDGSGKAFAISRATNVSASDDGERMNATYFTPKIEYNYSGTTDRLNIQRYLGESGDLSADVWTFVVKLKDDSTVYQGDTYMAQSSFLAVSTLPQAVDRNKSIMIFNSRLQKSALGAELRGAITSDTQVGFNRRYSGTSAGEGYAYWYVIEFGTLGRGEGGEVMLPISDTCQITHQLGQSVDEDFGFYAYTAHFRNRGIRLVKGFWGTLFPCMIYIKIGVEENYLLIGLIAFISSIIFGGSMFLCMILYHRVFANYYREKA